VAYKGYILLHRSMLDNLLWSSDEPFSRRDAWIDLLLMANHQDKNTVIEQKALKIKRGQLWTSQKSLATRWHWSLGKHKRFMVLLKNEGMIDYKTTKNGTLITLIKYDVFQGERNTDDNAGGDADGVCGGVHSISMNNVNNVNKERGREFQ